MYMIMQPCEAGAGRSHNIIIIRCVRILLDLDNTTRSARLSMRSPLLSSKIHLSTLNPFILGVRRMSPWIKRHLMGKLA
jgi:hypothetical protein